MSTGSPKPSGAEPCCCGREFHLFACFLLILFGQITANVSTIVHLALLLGGFLFSKRVLSNQKSWLMFAAPLLLGVLSGRSIIPTHQLSARELSVIVVPAGPSRFPQRGLHRIRLRLVSILEEDTFVFLNTPHYSLCRAVHLPWRNLQSLAKGEPRVMQIRLYPLREKTSRYFARYGGRVDSSCKVLSSSVAQSNGRTTDELRSSEGEGILYSLAFGLPDQISFRTERDFKALGIYHLLVLSGLHLNLLVGGARSVFEKISQWRTTHKTSTHRSKLVLQELLFLSPAVVLAIYSGFGPSCSRAIVWLLIGSFARINGRRLTFLSQFFTTAIILLLGFPGIYEDRGLWITACALLGIFHASFFSGKGLITSGLITSVVVSLYAHLIVLFLFGEISPGALVVGPILTLGFSGFILWIIWMAVALKSFGLDGGVTMETLASTTAWFRDILHQCASMLPDPVSAQSPFTCSMAALLGMWLLGDLLWRSGGGYHLQTLREFLRIALRKYPRCLIVFTIFKSYRHF